MEGVLAGAGAGDHEEEAEGGGAGVAGEWKERASRVQPQELSPVERCCRRALPRPLVGIVTILRMLSPLAHDTAHPPSSSPSRRTG